MESFFDFLRSVLRHVDRTSYGCPKTTYASNIMSELCTNRIFRSAMISLSTYLQGEKFRKFKKTLSREFGALDSTVPSKMKSGLSYKVGVRLAEKGDQTLKLLNLVQVLEDEGEARTSCQSSSVIPRR